MHNAAFSELARNWSQLARNAAGVQGGPPRLQPDAAELEQALADALEAEQRQLAHRVAAQQATRDLEAAKLRAHEAATRLRSGLRGHFGRSNPVLLVFGMRPYPGKAGRENAQQASLGEPLPNGSGDPEAVGGPFPNRSGASVHAGERLPNGSGAFAQDGEALPNGPATSVHAGERLPTSAAGAPSSSAR